MESNEATPSGNHHFLKRYTSARIALGMTGVSVPTRESLAFKLAHARAIDAVYDKMEEERLTDELTKYGHGVIKLQSRVTSRKEFLLRPELGRRLSERSEKELRLVSKGSDADLAISISDGLSAAAINRHALPLLELLLSYFKEQNISVGPISLVENGRVAISDEIGSCLNSKLSIILIGERPGLTSPDGLSVYFTYNPKPGNTNADRNCISNIRPEGLTYERAAVKLKYLLTESLQRKISGVYLKDLSGEFLQ